MNANSKVIDELKARIEQIESCGFESDSGALGFSSEEESDCFDRVVSLSSFRDRSQNELRRRLTEEEFSHDAIESSIRRAVRCNLVNDERFADSRIRGLVSKGMGVPGIEKDLQGHGIDPSTIEGWPEAYVGGDSYSEFDRALAYLDRNPSRSKNLVRGSFQKLVSRGYSADVATRAAFAWADSYKAKHSA